MSSPEIITFGAEVRRRRLAMGLSQGAFAAHAGISPGCVVAVENGTYVTSLSIIVKIAKGFGVDPGDLFGLGGLSPAGVEFARLYQRVPREVRGGVLDILRAGKGGPAR